MHRSQLTATLPLFFSFALLTSQTLAADFTGRVVGVSDGDTITVLHDGKGERIRLHGIDCPEKRQAFGLEFLTMQSDAQAHLRLLISALGK